MIVKTIHGEGSHVESFNGNMLISNCNVTVEENMVDQLNDIRLVNSIIKLSDKTVFTNEHGQPYYVESINEKSSVDDIYKDEGIAIFINGKLIYGIYPDNLENNLEALIKGDMKIDWEVIKNNYLK